MSSGNTKKPPKKKDRSWRVRVDDELDEQAEKYAKEHNISLGALIRNLVRWWTNPEDPRPPPPDIEDEKKRPPKKKPKPEKK